MHFNIEELYLKRGVDFITRGTNVKKGEINISCPFCNASSNPDPSYHLGVAPETGYWSCWRNRKHRGKKLHRLLMKLLRISYKEACDILGEKIDWIREGSFEIFEDNFDINNLFGEQDVEEIGDLEFDKDFRRFGNYMSERPFLRYLEKGRGFHRTHVMEVIEAYDFYFCISGKWQDRLILPVRLDGKLMTWTGRHLQPNAELRYRSLSEKEGALMSIKDLVFNYDELVNSGGKTLFVCEGPFDAIKLDFYARDLDCRSTALFSKALRLPQSYLLSDLSNVFDKIVILLDAEELEATLMSDATLAFLHDQVDLGELPAGFHDPGELTSTAVYQLVERYS